MWFYFFENCKNVQSNCWILTISFFGIFFSTSLTYRYEHCTKTCTLLTSWKYENKENTKGLIGLFDCQSRAIYPTWQGLLRQTSDVTSLQPFLVFCLTLFETGGCSTSPYCKSALYPQKWPKMTPNFMTFSFSIWHIQISKNFVWFLQRFFGLQTPMPLNVYFQLHPKYG